MKKPSVTAVQLAMMAIGSALVFPFTFMPILNSPPANQDVWIVLLLSAVYIIAINSPLLFLMNRYRGLNAGEMSEVTFGKIVGKLILIPFILFFLYCFTACMLITAQFINLFILPDTPIWAVILLSVVPVTYAAYKGAGTIGRLAVVLVPLAILMIVLYFLMGLNKMEFSEFKPVLADSTFAELNKGALLTGGRYSEILIFWVFSYFLAKKNNINKTYFSALGLFLICFMLMLIPTVAVLGVSFAKHVWNPYFVFSRSVEALTFLERVQAFNILTWFPVAILKLTMYNYMASFVFSRVVGAKTHKYFVIPFSVAAVIVCLLPFMNNSSTVLLLRSDRVFPYIILPVIFVLPLVILVVYLIRRKKIDSIIKQKRETAS